MFDGFSPPEMGDPNRTSAEEDDDLLQPYQRTDEGLLKWIEQCFQESCRAKKDIAPRRSTDWNMLANRQWEDSDRKRLDSQRRPVLTLNMLHTIIAAVEGEERTNRQELKIYGSGQEDDDAAHGLNRILKWIMDQCGGQFALSQQFRSQIVCGEGWVVPDVDKFEDPEGKIKLLFVDDDEMFDDPLAKDPTSADSRYLIRLRMMTEDEGEARWPGFRENVRTQAFTSPDMPETDGAGFRDIYSTPNDPKSPRLFDAKNKLWAVFEVWWSQIEPGWVVVDEETGLLVEKTEDEFEAMKAQREQEQQGFLQRVMMGQQRMVQPEQIDPATGMMMPPVMEEMPPAIEAKKQPIKCIYQAFTAYKTLLERKKSPLKDLKRFPYVPARAIYDKEEKEWFGLIRLITDVQRQHNIEQSVIVQLMQAMVKSGWLGPKGSFHNKNYWQENAAAVGAMLEYNATRGKPEQLTPPTIPRHVVEMAFSRPQSMREICGVNVEMMGQKQGQDPGVVLEQRQKAAKTVQAPLFDNFHMSKLEVGKVLISYIRTYVKPGRMIRVLGPEGARYVQFTQQMQLSRYDVMVEETNETVNDRVAALNLLQTTIPRLLQSGMTLPPEIVDLVPMAPHIRDAIKRQISFELTLAGRLPPPGWQPGMPVPLPAPAVPNPDGAPAPPAA